ncbi:WD40-repeat-containing domain protein [Melampsora americana]|nr:WD40-repeat-containing domain protein [Melampsora americana]
MSDLLIGQHHFGTEEVYKIKFSNTLNNLLAVGTTHTLQILRLNEDYSSTVIKVFRIGTRVQHLAWGPCSLTTLENNLEVLKYELLIGCEDQSLRLIKSQSDPKSLKTFKSSIKVFGGGYTGHSGRITSIAWCSVSGYSNIIASSASDNCILIWNIESNGGSTRREEEGEEERTDIPTPTLLGPLRFTPLTISFHPHSSSKLMVYDSTGTIKLIDWTKPNQPILLSLIEPRSLIRKLNSIGSDSPPFGMAEWKIDEMNVLGSINGKRWSVWDLRSTLAGNPMATGEIGNGDLIPDTFKWCPTNSRLFALSSSSPNTFTSGTGPIQIYFTSFPQSPRSIRLPHHILQSRSRVHDIEWSINQIGIHQNDVLLVAIGKEVLWIQVGKKDGSVWMN